jgi:hypothetical protein
MDDTAGPPFRRELADYITVAVNGVVEGVDDDITTRAPARVVVSLPDYVADGLAHLVARLWKLSVVFGDERGTGIDERPLAEALFAASAAGGYRCPQGSLHLTPNAEAPQA